MKNCFIIIIIFLVFASCNGIAVNNSLGIFEKTASLPNQSWNSNNRLSFTFTISDTSSLYNFFIVIRHTDAYHYNNIWLNLITVAPRDTAQTQQLNLKLGDNTKGWLGTGMDDIFEHRILINRYPEKLRAGNYTFMLQHIMREDNLPDILNAGIRIEKIKQ